MGPADDFYKLYLVAGGFKGSQGVGATNIPWLDTLVDWVEKGQAPDELIGKRIEDGRTVRTRRVCAHPRIAAYKGTADRSSADSFICKE